MEEPQPYDPAKEYFVGDRVTSPSPDGNWLFTCIRHHMPSSGNSPIFFGYSPWPGEHGWDERWYGDGYDRHYQTTFLGEYWEPIPPEWDTGKTYNPGSIVQYKGRAYEATWRYNKMWVSDGTLEDDDGFMTEGGTHEDRTPTLLPPNQDIDQDFVRTWTIMPPWHRRSAPFNFSPYNFERNDMEDKKLKVGISPYNYYQNRSQDGFHGELWRWGMNNPNDGNVEGASLEVYRDYEPIEQEDEENYFLGLLDKPGGDTASGMCGFAFQNHFTRDIAHHAQVSTFREEDYPPSIGYQQTYSVGASSASPDYNEGPPQVGSPGGDGDPDWTGNGRIFAGHNHPLYHQRSIQIKGIVISNRGWWVKDPVDPTGLVPTTYSRRSKITRSIKSATNQFVIGSHTLTSTSPLLVDAKEVDPILYTEIGRFTLTPVGDTFKSLGAISYKVVE
jgi:hypothetical protein